MVQRIIINMKDTNLNVHVEGIVNPNQVLLMLAQAQIVVLTQPVKQPLIVKPRTGPFLVPKDGG